MLLHQVVFQLRLVNLSWIWEVTRTDPFRAQFLCQMWQLHFDVCKVNIWILFDLVDQRLQILKFLSRMNVVAHDTVEKVEIKHFVLLVRLKYKRASLSLRWARREIINLYHNLLKPLMQVTKDFLEFLNNSDIYVGFKLDYMLWNTTHLHRLRVLILEGSLPLKMWVVALLYVLKDFSVLFVFIRELSAQETFNLFVKIKVIYDTDITKAFNLLSTCLNPPITVVHKRFPQMTSISSDSIGNKFLLLDELMRENLLFLILFLSRVPLVERSTGLLQGAKDFLGFLRCGIIMFSIWNLKRLVIFTPYIEIFCCNFEFLRHLKLSQMI